MHFTQSLHLKDKVLVDLASGLNDNVKLKCNGNTSKRS